MDSVVHYSSMDRHGTQIVVIFVFMHYLILVGLGKGGGAVLKRTIKSK